MGRNSKYGRIGLAATVALLFGAACGDDSGPPAGETTIRITGVLDRTGALADETQGQALDLAEAHINEALAASSAYQHVSVLTDWQDSTNTPMVAGMRAVEAVANSTQTIVVGSTGDALELMKHFYDNDASNDLDVPILSILGSSPSFNNPDVSIPNEVTQAAFRDVDGWHYPLILSNPIQARVLANLVYSQATGGDINGDGTWKVSIHANGDAFGVPFANALAGRMAELDPDSIVETITVDPTINLDTFDWGAQLALLTDSLTEQPDGSPAVGDVVPDAIVNVTFPGIAVRIIHNHDLGSFDVPLFHMSAAFQNATRMALTGDEGVGQIGTVHVPADTSPQGDTFRTLWEDTYAPLSGYREAKIYDAVVLATLATLQAARVAGIEPDEVTGAQIRDQLSELQSGEVVGPGPTDLTRAFDLIADGTPINYEGASAPLDFDENRRVVTRLTTFEIQRDSFLLGGTIFDCVADPATCPAQ